MTSSPSESADPLTTPDESTTTPNYARRRAVIGITGAAALAVVGIGFAAATGWGAPADVVTVVQATNSSSASQVTPSSSASSTPSASGTANESPTATATPTASAAPGAPTTDLPYDISTGSSVTVLVNKHYSLDPVDYAPRPTIKLTKLDVPSMNDHSLREDAAEAFKDMYEAALADGITLDMTSGYRDYDLQTELYNGHVEDLGQKGADLTSARPGSSEHQTGLAADISAPGESDCVLTECFGETEASDWLVAHSHEYGFILRYPDGETDVTGYEYEPWHYRFIGVDAAAAYHESGAATYEEFLGVEPAPDYED